VHVDSDLIVYLRETREERLLCLASRRSSEPVRVSLAELGASELETVLGAEPITER
jgi:hypothetical protein